MRVRMAYPLGNSTRWQVQPRKDLLGAVWVSAADSRGKHLVKMLCGLLRRVCVDSVGICQQATLCGFARLCAAGLCQLVQRFCAEKFIS